MPLLHLLFWLLAAPLALIVGYLQLLTAAAFAAPRATPARAGRPTNRFLILVPAHNEEKLLPDLLSSLADLDYPRDLYQVHVVADNCTDGTAVVGRAGGATVHERFNQELRGKGYALEWLIKRLWEREAAHDAIVILDADSVVSDNFLRVMDARLARGERVIQAYYTVRDPAVSWGSSLRTVALIVLHYLRPQGRMVLGGSTGLKGNGIVFAAEVIERHRWTASLTEDIEYHMELILAGERAMFAPDAVVWAEMPHSLAAAQTQNERWEKGRMEMVRSYVPRLLAESARRRSFLLLDAAVEQLIPPFSIVVAASAACLTAALALRSRAGTGVALACLIGQALYLVAGLRLSQAPRKVYQALLYAPLFVLWKLLLYLRLLVGLKPRAWVRTARNEG